MRNRLFLVIAMLALSVFWGSFSEAFDIQYPGEPGFFIGMPMVYVISLEGDENFGQEGTFTFGQDRIAIDGVEYYDSVFEFPSSTSDFYLGIDSVAESLTQKGIKLGATEINLEPALTAVKYPLSPGDTWSETIKLTATDLQVGGLEFPFPISIENVNAETIVSSMSIQVPAGDFETLLVETTYDGSLLGIPMTLVQRTWLAESNITVKRNIEFTKPTQNLLYDIELSKLPAASVSSLDKGKTTWADIKIGY